MHACRCCRCAAPVRVCSGLDGRRYVLGSGRGVQVAHVKLSKEVILIVACRASSDTTWAGDSSAVD